MKQHFQAQICATQTSKCKFAEAVITMNGTDI